MNMTFLRREYDNPTPTSIFQTFGRVPMRGEDKWKALSSSLTATNNSPKKINQQQNVKILNCIIISFEQYQDKGKRDHHG